MAADNAANMSMEQSNGDRANPHTQAPRPNGAGETPDSGDDLSEQHDLTYIRTRRARALDPRRSLGVASSGRTEGATPVGLRRAPTAVLPAPQTKPARRSRSFWFLSAALFALVAGSTFAVFYLRQTWAERASVAPEVIRATTPVSDLQMHVEAQGERVLVSWNPRASGVQSANGGLLTIEDAGQRREFSLDASQAANGSVLYRPASGDVTFRLQIRNAAGTVFNDSLRVLDPAKAALAKQASAPRSANPISKRAEVRAAPKPPSSSSGEQRVAKTGSSGNTILMAKNRSTPASHMAGTGNASSQADPPQKMPKAPSIPGLGVAAPSASEPLQTLRQGIAPPATAPPASGVSVVQARGIVPAETASDGFIPPQAITQVMPTLRSSLRSVLRPGTKVEVSVRIDGHGRVKRARVIGDLQDVDIGIQKAAVDAAKQWRFEPARLNGKRVESEHTIVFRFQPQQNRER